LFKLRLELFLSLEVGLAVFSRTGNEESPRSTGDVGGKRKERYQLHSGQSLALSFYDPGGEKGSLPEEKEEGSPPRGSALRLKDLENTLNFFSARGKGREWD